MNTPERLMERLERLFGSTLGIEVPSADTDLVDEDIMDSLLMVDLLVSIEQEFGVSVDIETLDLETFRTIRGIAGYLTAELAPSASARTAADTAPT